MYLSSDVILWLLKIWSAWQGEEVYNTYGELANKHLLHMYGFTEEYPNNHYDIVSSTAGNNSDVTVETYLDV